jgi:uncharacterized membrane protein YpjA
MHSHLLYTHLMMVIRRMYLPIRHFHLFFLPRHLVIRLCQLDDVVDIMILIRPYYSTLPELARDVLILYGTCTCSAVTRHQHVFMGQQTMVEAVV